MKILMISESKKSQQMLEIVMGKMEGSQIVISDSASILKDVQENPDLILLDTSCEQWVDLIDRIKKIDHQIQLLILAETTDACQYHVIEKGADGILMKPFDERELAVFIKGAIKNKKTADKFRRNDVTLRRTDTQMIELFTQPGQLHLDNFVTSSINQIVEETMNRQLEDKFDLSNPDEIREKLHSLLKNEACFRAALKNSRITVAHIDRNLRYTWIYNPHPDFDASKVIGKRDDEIADNEGTQRLIALKARVIETGESQREEIAFSLSDGIHYYDVSVEPLVGDHGQVIGATTSSAEITEQIMLNNKLQESNNMLKDLTANVPGVIYQFQFFPDGRVCIPFASEGLETYFGLNPEDVVMDAASAFDRIHADDYDEVQASVWNSYHSLKLWEKDFRVISPRGEKWIRGRATPKRLSDESVLWHGFLMDITTQKETEKTLFARQAELSSLSSFSKLMRAARNTDELFPLMLKEAQRMLQADDGVISMISPDRSHFNVTMGNGYWGEKIGSSFPVEEGLSGLVFRTEKPYHTNDYRTEIQALRHGDYLDNIGQIVLVPLKTEEEVIGVLGISKHRDRCQEPFTDSEVELLSSIGEIAGNALRRQTLYDQAQQRIKQVQALHNIDMAITGSMDLRVTYNVILNETMTLLNLDAASILQLEPHTGMLNYEACHGFNVQVPRELKMRMGEGFGGRIVTAREPLLIPDLNKVERDPVQSQLLEQESFQSYFAVPLIAKGRVQGVMEVYQRRPFYPNQDWVELLEILAGQTAIAIDNAELFLNIERSHLELLQAYDSTIEGWAFALDLKDEETEEHSRRVTWITLDIARKMGIKYEELAHIRRGALLHDIGKMGIPDAILLKPGALTEDEWEIMKLHPTFAFKMLSRIEYLRPAIDIPYCHHEKWDGTGYPRGLRGEEIPLSARIFAVADVYDALTSNRPYRKAWSHEKTLEYIRAGSGRHFDPNIVELVLEKIEKYD